jgi:hypothetical protein
MEAQSNGTIHFMKMRTEFIKEWLVHEADKKGGRATDHRVVIYRRRVLIVGIFIAMVLIWTLGGCDLVKEGVTGEKQDMASGSGSAETVPPSAPAAFDIIGDWFGVYNGNEYLAVRFAADGKCELQTAVYPSDMFGPRYYGDYRWGGEGGNEIILDMYKGVSGNVDSEDGYAVTEWSDGGRESATTALSMTFAVYGCDVKSVALKAASAGVDTEGYTVVKSGAFVVIFPGAADSAAGSFFFGTEPADPTEGKTKVSIAPNTFGAAAERFFTTDDLNIRCGSGTDNASYGMALKGTAVYKIGWMEPAEEDWVFVLLEGGGGWCSAEYLSDTPPEAATATVQ